MAMPSCTPELQFPGAWPESPVIHMRDSHQELHARPATHLPPLRIIVPPTEYCPFSTDLTLPITPLSLPTPASSSCLTFTDMQDPANETMAVPAPVLLSAVTEFASPTSSQFLLMPPTPHLEGVDSGIYETSIRVSPLATPAVANEPLSGASNETKSGNLRPWEVSASTWLSDLGGHTETDRILRHALVDIIDTESSPASTPALSPSAVSPSQLSSPLAYNLSAPLARSPAPSPYPNTMSSPARLALKPTGTDTFPSTLDSLQAWRQSVTPGIPPSEDPCPPSTEDVHGSQLEGLAPETYPSVPLYQPHSRPLSPHLPRVSKSRTFIKRAKMFGGRVKQLVIRQNVNKHCGSMDRGVSFSVVTSQDSDNGSVILITAPPPPYDVRSFSHCQMGQEHIRSRTISEYSSAVQASTAEVPTTVTTELGSRQGGGNRNVLRRLSLAALSTVKKH